MTFRARVGRDRSRSSRRGLIERHPDVVNTVTVCAYGRARHSPRYRLSVNALNELGAFGLMTLSASRRNVDLGNGRLRIRRRQDIVTVVAVGANRGVRITARDGFRVDAFSIR